MAAHRGPRRPRRPRLPADRRPGQGHVHRRRLQRLPGRDREPSAAPPRGAAGGRDRHPRRAARRGRHGLRRDTVGRPGGRRRDPGLVPRRDRQLQGPAGDRDRRRAARERHRQGGEERAAGPRRPGPTGVGPVSERSERTVSTTSRDRDSGAGRNGLGALDGLRVVELGVWVAAPATAALLADWGADVIKVEPPSGDPMRGVFGSLGIGDDMPNPAFALDNRGKRSIALDLRETADVFISNLRPDALDKLGLEPEATVARHPRLVYCSVSGYGLHGDDRNRPTYDIGAFWARSGLASQMADGEGSPLNARGGIGDHITGLAALSGVLAAVLEQRHTGRGRVVEVSLLRTGAYVLGWDLGIQMSLGKVAGSEPRHRNQAPLMNPYRAADDRWFFFTGLEAARHIPAVCRALGRPDLLDDPRFADAKAIRRHRTEVIAVLDEIVAERPLAEWAERFEAEGVWWAPAQTPAEVVHDPQLVANDGFVELEGGAVRSVNGPVTFSGLPAAQRAHVPTVGEHTDEVMAELAARASDAAGGGRAAGGSGVPGATTNT